MGQVIEVKLANLLLRYRRYLPRPEKKFHLWSIFPQKSLSYKNILSRMKKNNLTLPVLLVTYNIRLYLLVGFICHFLMKGQSDCIICLHQFWPYTLMLVTHFFRHSHGLEIKMGKKEDLDLHFDNASPFWKCTSFSFIWAYY